MISIIACTTYYIIKNYWTIFNDKSRNICFVGQDGNVKSWYCLSHRLVYRTGKLYTPSFVYSNKYTVCDQIIFFRIITRIYDCVDLYIWNCFQLIQQCMISSNINIYKSCFAVHFLGKMILLSTLTPYLHIDTSHATP